MDKLFSRILIFMVVLLNSLSFAGPSIPSSSRSREAIKRTRPKLEKELKKKGFTLGAPLFIRGFKESNDLEVWLKKDSSYHLFKTYEICTYGSGTIGPKVKQGDGQAPEGFYFVTPRSLNPVSNFHLSFNLGYPNAYDRAHGRTGSALMVHGNCISIGCYAMTNPVIEEIFTLADAAFRNGQPFFRVHLFPFRMTKENLEKHSNSPWFTFWQNLKTGYDWFENHNYRPPNVTVKNKRYIFGE